MLSARWCSNNLNSNKDITFKDVKSEVKELLEARTIDEVWEETGDVLYFIYCWLYCRYGLNLPMIGAMRSVRKFIARLHVWETIFNNVGLTFDTKYLVNGSNYNRAMKVLLAISLAREDQGEKNMYNKMVVVGTMLYETDTHYVTLAGECTVLWHKKWYRLPLDL